MMHQRFKRVTIFAVVIMLLVILPSGSSESNDTRAPPPDPGQETGTYSINQTEISYYDREGNSINATLYYPGPKGEEYPGIVFGEDYNDKGFVLAESYDWVGRNIAKWGYIVLIPKYTNNSIIGYQGFDDHWLWINQTYDAINYLIENCSYCKVDEDRIALMGHGGGGSLSIIEASLDKRVKCVIALSPVDRDFTGIVTYNPPFPTDWVEHLSPVPVQIQVGRDFGIPLPQTHEEKYSRPIYEAAKGPKELVVINRGNHLGFFENSLPISQKNLSLRYSVSFLNYYLNNDKDYYELIITEDSIGIINSEVEFSELDNIIQDIEVVYSGTNTPFEIDLKNGNAIVEIYANITPRGIGWGNSFVKVDLSPPNGESIEKKLIYNNKYNVSAGYYYGTFEIDILSPVGEYGVVLEAINTNGDTMSSDMMTFTVMSSAKKPVAILEVTPLIAEDGDKITFNASKSFDEEDVEIISYNFSFGDGNHTGWIVYSTETHHYQESGMYFASVMVKNQFGAESEKSEEVKILIDEIPRAKIDSNISEIYTNESVAFDANDSWDNDGKIDEYLFDFGDGENSSWTNKAFIIHRYLKEGEYEARVKVKDDVGAESKWSPTILITVEKKDIDDNGNNNGESSSSGSNKWYFVFLIAAIFVIIGGGFLFHKVGDEEGEEQYIPPAQHLGMESSSPKMEGNIKKGETDLKKEIPKKEITYKPKKEEIKEETIESPLKEEFERKIVEKPQKEEEVLKEEFIDKKTEIFIKKKKIDEKLDFIMSEKETSDMEYSINQEEEIEWDEEEITIKEEKKIFYKKERKPKKKSRYANIPMITGKKSRKKPRILKTQQIIYPKQKLQKQPTFQKTTSTQQYPAYPKQMTRPGRPLHQRPVPPPPQSYPKRTYPQQQRPLQRTTVQPQSPIIEKGPRKKAIVHSKAVFIPKDARQPSKPFYGKPQYSEQPTRYINEQFENERKREEEQKDLARPNINKQTKTFDDLMFPDLDIGIPKKFDKTKTLEEEE